MKYYSIFSFLLLVGCGSAVEIPPAHVGKVLTSEGYKEGVLTPSKFRLPACFAYCDKLVVMEASDNSLDETMRIFMPKDKLNIMVDVRGTFSIPSDERTVDSLFSRVPADGDSIVTKISAEKVYKVYGRQAVRGVVRASITRHTIQDLMDNRESIGEEIHHSIAKKLSSTNTPIQVTRFELSDIQPPKVIVEAQESAKRREIDIQKAEADAQVELVKAARELEIAKKNRLVEREKAEGIAEQNKIAAQSVSEKLLAYRRLDVAERIFSKLAESDNVIIVPADSSMFSNISDDAVFSRLLGNEVRR